MAVQLSVQELGKKFASKQLFSGLNFGIGTGDRIGLIGPNGTGKSTLLKILVGQETPDQGQVVVNRGLRIGYLSQSPVFDLDHTVYECVFSGAKDPDSYESMAKAHELISKLNLNDPQAGEDRKLGELSGGWKKRVALARELVKEPDLLIMDEPTNHLDLESIMWLETFLVQNQNMSVLMVTHDRLFLQKTCNVIMDLDRRNPNGLIRYTGPYAEFLDFKAQALEGMQRLESSKKNQLRSETEWLRRGSIARQTKQQARIDRAHDLKSEVRDLKEQNRNTKINVEFGEIDKAPKRMIEAMGISKTIHRNNEDLVLFKNFSIKIGPNSRLGLIGKNGSGKTSLIRALVGMDKPDQGTVFVNDDIKVAYFEQQKQELQNDVSVLKTICPEGDYVHVQGKPVFARSYLQRFHFKPEQMDLPVQRLSGGEQSRLMIAKLMTQTEPVLVLDEPTNDLDIETLEVLEESLKEFRGALILVSHDRYFMDRIVDRIVAFTGNDGELLQFSDFFQWEDWYQGQTKQGKAQEKKAATASVEATKSKTKLSYKDQRDLDQMESNIQAAEAEVTALESQLRDPAYKSDFNKLQELSQQHGVAQKKVEALYKRWDEILKMKGD